MPALAPPRPRVAPVARVLLVVVAGLVPLAAARVPLADVIRPAQAHGPHGTAERLPRIRGPFVVRQLSAGGATYRVAVWRPPGFSPDRPWPAIVYLHGAGESGVDVEAPTRVGLGPELVAHPERWPFLVVFPQKPSEQEEWEEREALVLAARDMAVRDLGADASGVALVGMSQGGHGVWMIGARHPGRWSALVPICGYGRVRTIARRVARVPVWAFHGLRDDQVDPRDSKDIVDAIAAERARLGLDAAGARLTLYPDANHNSWDAAVAEPGLPAWIASHRTGAPDRADSSRAP